MTKSSATSQIEGKNKKQLITKNFIRNRRKNIS